MRKKLVLVALIVMGLAGPAAAATERQFTLMLDWTPNPAHVGLYYAQAHGLFHKAGLDVAIRAPSDPSSPLKLVAGGKADLAVSYEPEVFFAAAKRLPVIAVAAVVPQPLNSVMAIDPSIRRIGDLRGKKIGITGVPSDYAALDTALHSGGLTRKDVTIVSVGYNLLPALLAHRVDAVIGAYRNVEGIELQQRGFRPTIIPLDRVGVPSYDELVLVASSSRLRTDPAYAAAVGRFVHAFLLGTARAQDDRRGSLALLGKVTASSKAFVARATPATLALLTGRHGVGCMDTGEWQRFGTWMHARGLLETPVASAAVMSTRYLPARCAASG